MLSTHRIQSQGIATLAAVTIISIVGTYATTNLISKYGLGGLLRLIWEGDHLSPEVRDAVDTLEDLEKRLLPKRKRDLNKIRLQIERAKLDSVDGGDENLSSDETTSFKSPNEERGQLQNDIILMTSPAIKKDISMLSHNLDTLVAKIDSVQSHGNLEVKERKKKLSNLLVEMMRDVDELIQDCGGQEIKK